MSRPASADEPGSAAERLWEAYRRTAARAERERLFDHYREFARSVARRRALTLQKRDLETSDVDQLAYTGLLEAIDRFNPDLGVPFEAFAVRRIQGAVLDGLAKASEVRAQMTYLARVRRERARSLAEAPTRADGAGKDAMSLLSEIAVGLAIGFMLEGAGFAAQEASTVVHAPSYDTGAWKDLVRRLSDEVKALPERQRTVIERHYVDGVSFTDISEALVLSRGRVSQLHREALETLRRRVGQRPGAFTVTR
jgi:RNA polymerase sigma factor for flagellar operon FliA